MRVKLYAINNCISKHNCSKHIKMFTVVGLRIRKSSNIRDVWNVSSSTLVIQRIYILAHYSVYGLGNSLLKYSFITFQNSIQNKYKHSTLKNGKQKFTLTKKDGWLWWRGSHLTY